MTEDSIASLSDHPLLKAHPGLLSAYESIKVFIKESNGDLQNKKDVLEDRCRQLKSSKSFNNRRLKNYLSCQIFMLKKHLSRLKDFESEVETRLKKILESSVDQTKNTISNEIDVNSNLEDQMEGTDTCDTSSLHSAESSTESAESGISSCAANDESFDSYNLPTKTETVEDLGQPICPTHPAPQVEVQEQQLAKLLADINKMKRRCKHILDVTDHYCVLSPSDLEEPLPDAQDGPASPKSPDPVFNHLLWSTLESLSSHIAVIAKSYTKRHSTEFSHLNSSKMN